jgi:hypothetical protein
MVITRSPGSIIFDRALSIVVLPEPVPPEMTTFIRLAPAIFSTVAIFSDIDPKPRIMSMVIGFSENLRMAMLRGRHRQRLLVHAERVLDVQDVIRDWLGEVEWSSKVRVSVDVDPYSFL